ncbi:bZIP transcription factor [Geosmithia morbida]|uniref:BZIP transcription factor n=1 Tax=Geosmithia morbida TaxID=1094350 RepID=A0A9P4YQL9_9HYPO|nr:bZIP transcription factor [Geosmithia morbida]KAF4119234.1 bZIP transcription factor [Geosmithia morbida]
MSLHPHPSLLPAEPLSVTATAVTPPFSHMMLPAADKAGMPPSSHPFHGELPYSPEAATKCRLRKRDQAKELEEHERAAADENLVLRGFYDELSTQILNLKNMVLEHAGCDCVLIHRYIHKEAALSVERMERNSAAAAAAAAGDGATAPSSPPTYTDAAAAAAAGLPFHDNQPSPPPMGYSFDAAGPGSGSGPAPALISEGESVISPTGSAAQHHGHVSIATAATLAHAARLRAEWSRQHQPLLLHHHQHHHQQQHPLMAGFPRSYSSPDVGTEAYGHYMVSHRHPMDPTASAMPLPTAQVQVPQVGYIRHPMGGVPQEHQHQHQHQQPPPPYPGHENAAWPQWT